MAGSRGRSRRSAAAAHKTTKPASRVPSRRGGPARLRVPALLQRGVAEVAGKAGQAHGVSVKEGGHGMIDIRHVVPALKRLERALGTRRREEGGGGKADGRRRARRRAESGRRERRAFEQQRMYRRSLTPH